MFNPTQTQSIPAGLIFAVAAPIVPPDCIYCKGQAVSRTAFARLVNVIGGCYGVGDGSKTLNIPDPEALPWRLAKVRCSQRHPNIHPTCLRPRDMQNVDRKLENTAKGSETGATVTTALSLIVGVSQGLRQEAHYTIWSAAERLATSPRSTISLGRRAVLANDYARPPTNRIIEEARKDEFKVRC